MSQVSFPPLDCKSAEDPSPVNKVISGWNRLFKELKKVRKEKLLNIFKPLPHGPEETPFVLVSEKTVNREVKNWEKCLVA